MGTDRRVDVLGVKVSVTHPSEALERVTSWIEDQDRHYVCVTGVHGVMESQDDPTLVDIHNRAGLTTPDGMPMVWAGRYAGAADIERVYGPDLMLAVIERGVDKGWRSYFYGGGPGVADELVERLTASQPGLKVAGTHTPPFRPLTDDENDAVVDDINGSGADLVWVGLSTPKQERWMAANRDRLHAPVLLGVGAAFDFHAGRVRQAPSWMQQAGLEWLFRLGCEPRRLWKRYLGNNPKFVAKVIQTPPRLVDGFERAS